MVFSQVATQVLSRAAVEVEVATQVHQVQLTVEVEVEVEEMGLVGLAVRQIQAIVIQLMLAVPLLQMVLMPELEVVVVLVVWVVLVFQMDLPQVNTLEQVELENRVLSPRIFMQEVEQQVE